MRQQRQALWTKAREQAIGAKLLMAEALRRGLGPTAAEVEERIREMGRQAGGEKAFAALLARQRLTLSQLRQSIVKGRQLDLLIAEIVAAVPEPDDEDVAEYFGRHAADYRAPDKAQVRHILIKPASKSENDRAACVSKLREIKARLADGADFAEQAAAHSECPSGRQTGGSLGWIARGVSLPEFDEVVFALPLTAVSDVVETPLGLHLIQKVAEEAGEAAPLEAVRDKIRELLRHNRRGQAIAQVVAALRRRAVIEVEDEPAEGAEWDAGVCQENDMTH